jgi:hypothetical protein
MADESPTTPRTPSADNESTSGTPMILKQKLVTLKVSHEIRFRKFYVTVRLGNMNNVEAVKEEVCKLRGINDPSQYKLIYSDHILVDDKTLQENQFDSTSQLFPVQLMHQTELQKLQLTEQRLVKKRERRVPQKNATVVEEKKKKPKNVDVKLRIQEKVNNQVIGCDITAKSAMKFEKIATMYCAHRKYPITKVVFASYGVLMEPTKTLNQLGLNEAGKVYTIQVYSKDRVNIADHTPSS